MRVAVTGAYGYIGRVLVQKLKNQGYNVVEIDSFRYNISIPSYLGNVIAADVRENFWLRHLEGCEVVIHLAALVGEPVCRNNPKEAWEVNFQSVVKLTEACRYRRKIIMPMTNSFYGNQEGVCTEESPIKPLSVYAQSKLAGENYLLNEPGQYDKNVSLRLATVYGLSPRLRTDLMVNHFTQEILGGGIKIADGGFKRNFISIEDVTDCFIFCIKNKEKMSGIYNVGNDAENTTKIELAQKIEFLLKKHRLIMPEYEYIKLVGEGYKDPDQRNYTISSKKIRDLGFECKDTIENQVIKMAGVIQGINPYPCVFAKNTEYQK